jgi:hypothetical protein
VGEDFVKTAFRLAWDSGHAGFAIVILVIGVALLVMAHRGWKIPWPKMPEPSPDLVENPPSPPMVVGKDGSIPISNPEVPPEPLP